MIESIFEKAAMEAICEETRSLPSLKKWWEICDD